MNVDLSRVCIWPGIHIDCMGVSGHMRAARMEYEHVPEEYPPFNTDDCWDPVAYVGFRAEVDRTSMKAERNVSVTARGHGAWPPNAGAHKFISMTTNALIMHSTVMEMARTLASVPAWSSVAHGQHMKAAGHSDAPSDLEADRTWNRDYQ